VQLFSSKHTAKVVLGLDYIIFLYHFTKLFQLFQWSLQLTTTEPKTHKDRANKHNNRIRMKNVFKNVFFSHELGYFLFSMDSMLYF